MPRSSSQKIGLTPQPLAPEDVAVWNWPLRDEGPKAWAILVAAIGIAILVWAIWADAVFALFTYAMLALALWRLWLPIRWELGLTGITLVVLGFRRRIPWLAVARFELRQDGVWLFADREPSPQRGTFIAYGGEKERVRACIQYYLGAWTAATDSTRSFEPLRDR
jgi:hypothetical protein